MARPVLNASENLGGVTFYRDDVDSAVWWYGPSRGTWESQRRDVAGRTIWNCRRTLLPRSDVLVQFVGNHPGAKVAPPSSPPATTTVALALSIPPPHSAILKVLPGMPFRNCCFRQR
jgi:hypothetical protein